MMTSNDKEEELLTLPYTLDVTVKQAAGQFIGRFLRELRDNARIVGNTCPQCGQVNVPPRIVCGMCSVRNGDFIELSDTGTVMQYSSIPMKFMDPSTGEMTAFEKPVGNILLDGGGRLDGFLEETDLEKLRIGLKVKAIFKPKEDRLGKLTDIAFFRTIE